MDFKEPSAYHSTATCPSGELVKAAHAAGFKSGWEVVSAFTVCIAHSGCYYNLEEDSPTAPPPSWSTNLASMQFPIALFTDVPNTPVFLTQMVAPHCGPSTAANNVGPAWSKTLVSTIHDVRSRIVQGWSYRLRQRHLRKSTVPDQDASPDGCWHGWRLCDEAIRPCVKLKRAMYTHCAKTEIAWRNKRRRLIRSFFTAIMWGRVATEVSDTPGILQGSDDRSRLKEWRRIALLYSSHRSLRMYPALHFRCGCTCRAGTVSKLISGENGRQRCPWCSNEG